MLITEKKEKVMGPSGHWGSMTFTQSRVEEMRTEAAQRSGEPMQAITTLHITGLQLLLFALCPPTQVVLHMKIQFKELYFVEQFSILWERNEQVFPHLGKPSLGFDLSKSS